jgi:hypothetical protein
MRKRLHNKELYALYSTPNKILALKLRIMRWAGHVVHMGQEQQRYIQVIGRENRGKETTWKI